MIRQFVRPIFDAQCTLNERCAARLSLSLYLSVGRSVLMCVRLEIIAQGTMTMRHHRWGSLAVRMCVLLTAYTKAAAYVPLKMNTFGVTKVGGNT